MLELEDTIWHLCYDLQGYPKDCRCCEFWDISVGDMMFYPLIELHRGI